jgi:hypothetical protein
LRKKEWNTGFCWRNLGERGHLVNLSLDERIILKRVFTKLDEGSIDWIDLSLFRYKWRSLVNVTTNIQVP